MRCDGSASSANKELATAFPLWHKEHITADKKTTATKTRERNGRQDRDTRGSRRDGEGV